jgi:hypothetical protein
MKELGETLALVVLVALILGLAFLFHGSPDVWDKLHDEAMREPKCERASKESGNG